MDIDESPKSAVQLITGPLRKSRSWKRIQNSNDNTVKPTYTNGKNESSKASNVWYKNLTETNWVKYKSQFLKSSHSSPLLFFLLFSFFSGKGRFER